MTLRSTLARLAAVLAIVGALPAHARIVQEPIQVAVRVADIHGRTHERNITVALFYDDRAPRPYPALVLNHGRSPKASERAAVSIGQMASAANWLTSLGFIVAVPIRVGYGVTGGPDVEYSGPCEKKVRGVPQIGRRGRVRGVPAGWRQRPSAFLARAGSLAPPRAGVLATAGLPATFLAHAARAVGSAGSGAQ